MSQPVDATATTAWAELQTLHDSLEPDLRGWFAADPKRAEAFSFHRRRSLRRPVQEPDQRRDPRRAGGPGRAGRADRAAGCDVRRRAHQRHRGPGRAAHRAPAAARCQPGGGRRRRGAAGARGAGQGVRVRRQGAQRRVDRRHRQADRDRGQYRDRRIRPRPGDGLRGAAALRPGGPALPVRVQHRPDRCGREDQGPGCRDHVVHRGLQDLHHAGDADQRPAGPGMAA